MLKYPYINPIVLQIGPLKIHWYGLMYIVGIGLAWLLALWRIRRRKRQDWSHEQVADMIFYCALGVILGGRIGYMLFYDFPALLDNPFNLFKIWQGGMSFHGGLLGVVLALIFFARKTSKAFFDVADFIVPLVPIGLAAGRVGNFINGELWGRETDVSWGMVFPRAGLHARHPSQLYEFLLEGVLLFLILWIYSSKPKPRMAISGMFLLCYGTIRIFCEFFRQPDLQLGFIAWDWLTMGQILSFPMVVIGIIFIVYAYRNNQTQLSDSR